VTDGFAWKAATQKPIEVQDVQAVQRGENGQLVEVEVSVMSDTLELRERVRKLRFDG
jgi:hypothetical protein